MVLWVAVLDLACQAAEQTTDEQTADTTAASAAVVVVVIVVILNRDRADIAVVATTGVRRAVSVYY